MHTRVARVGGAVSAIAFALLSCLRPTTVLAQTDYFNTDAGRPIRIEDAYAIERRAIELQVAPLRLERPRAGSYRWGVEPELALGLFPRMQVEFGLPLVHAEAPGGARTTGLAGLEVSALYNLNAETILPALALAGEVVLPVGGFAPAQAVPTVKAIATRTFPWARFHVNGQMTFANATDLVRPGQAGQTTPAKAEFTRWLAGIAIDKTLPLRSLLVTAELVASAPLDAPRTRQWDAAAGVRRQLSPRIAFDAGGGYRLRGEDQGWFVTTGAAVAIGFPNFRAR